MPTNLKQHRCGKMTRMTYISFNKKDRYTEIPELAHSGFSLELTERKREGKLEPKAYTIKCPIDYCPFCGEKLEPKPHFESCDCDLCQFEKVMRGEIKDE